MVRMIAEAAGSKAHLTRVFNPLIDTIFKNHPMVKKAFGNLYYDQSVSDFGFDYRPYSLEESILEIAQQDGWGR